MKQTDTNQAEMLTPEEAEIIKSLLNYPTLERVFDPAGSGNLHAFKEKLQSTMNDLERVIRRGTKTDAEKASKAVEAYQITLNFLDELENARRAK